MTEAILIFSPHGSPIKGFSHKIKGRVHWILQDLCVSCAVLGLAAIFYNKHLNSKPHFTSWHGVLGLLTVCVVGLQSLAALPLIYHSLAKCWSLAKLKRYHAASGLITYLLGSMNLLLGLCSAWFTASVSDYTWYLSLLCPAVSALMIMNQVTSAYIAKKRLQSWQSRRYRTLTTLSLKTCAMFTRDLFQTNTTTMISAAKDLLFSQEIFVDNEIIFFHSFHCLWLK